jgi:biopolymer transport protein ExbD
MRFRRRTRGRVDEAVIDVTSLIDAAFILIIFLLVTTSFKRKEHAFDIELPTASSEEIEVSTRSHVVFVGSGGRYQLVPITGDETVSNATRADADFLDSTELRGQFEALFRTDPDTPLRLVVDRDTAYQHLITAINAARESGARKLQFPYDPGDPGPSPPK